MFSSRTHRSTLKRSGFTLVELLVVITIIGILVGMLLPAVNAARESGRNAQCKNNLKQMGTACLAHEEAQGIFPTGGWGWYWVGDPDRGFGDQQPGGWIYNILPHTEMNGLHDLGRTVPGQPANNSAKQAAILQLVSTSLPFTSCPTRRRPALFPMPWSSNISYNSGSLLSAPAGFLVARTDYAVNCGSGGDQCGAGPGAGADAYATNGSLTASATAAQAAYFGAYPLASRESSNFSNYNGISFELSTIRKDDISDGLSSTLLVGEKYLGADSYGTGHVGADNENEYVGFDNDIGRSTSKAPKQDRWGADDPDAFGSAHANFANFVLCDGSVVTINYSVDAATFKLLGGRADGTPVDMSKL